MFQGALHNRDETIVFENPEDPTTAKREVVMQAHIGDGPWHRLTPNHQHTACGLEFNAATAVPRREQLVGELCLKCFTDYERLVAADAAAEARRAANEFTDSTPPRESAASIGARWLNTKPTGKRKK